MSDNFGSVVETSIWKEVPESDNAFVASKCLCHGYDVYGDLLGKASYIEYLYLLFKGQRPTLQFSRALEIIAIAIANPGPRDPSVHAAMAAYVSGTPAATSLINALAVGAGSYLGGREVYLASQNWQRLQCDADSWRTTLEAAPAASVEKIWPDIGHHAGFDPYGKSCALMVRQTLDALVAVLDQGALFFLQQNRLMLEAATGYPLAMAGVVAAALIDLGFNPEESEMLALLLRLPGAAAHALEQGRLGFRKFPFFEIELENDPRSSTPKE